MSCRLFVSEQRVFFKIIFVIGQVFPQFDGCIVGDDAAVLYFIGFEPYLGSDICRVDTSGRFRKKCKANKFAVVHFDVHRRAAVIDWINSCIVRIKTFTG